MKKLKHIAIALVCTALASCMGDNYDAPNLNENPFGNKELVENNVITVAQLKEKFADVILSNSVKEITEDLQIKGRVSGNDIEGNLYNMFALQDETGAMLVSVGQGGLHGFLGVGQEVLLSLKGLYIGGYGNQPQIGGVYYNKKKGIQQVGRLNRYQWETHYKLMGLAQPDKIVPEEFDKDKIADKQYLADKCGKLMIIKNVNMKDANGKNVFAPKDGSVRLLANCANREIKGFSDRQMVVRTSTFAKFANMPMPKDEINLVGIFTRFKDTWQILLRSSNDIQPVTKK